MTGWMAESLIKVLRQIERNQRVSNLIAQTAFEAALPTGATCVQVLRKGIAEINKEAI
jgi:hypothetical protein